MLQNYIEYSRENFEREAADFLAFLRPFPDAETARSALFSRISDYQYDAHQETSDLGLDLLVVVRDCARAFRGLLRETSDRLAGFSVMQALFDLAHGRERPDLGPAFYAQMLHLVRGVEGRPSYTTPEDLLHDDGLSGREAALQRSEQLDRLWRRAEANMAHYPDGLSAESVARRAARRAEILAVLGGTPADWTDWRWQVRRVARDPEQLAALVPLAPGQEETVRRACAARLPFGVTPYYLSLMDHDPEAGRDRAVRAQVIPPADYVEEMVAMRHAGAEAFDFMQERDTSPIDLVTRRYPGIVILKPFNTCPQICVYCQRNWEIDEVLAPRALASAEKIEAACRWIEEHPAITEVLITGGDPLTLSDARLRRLLQRVAAIPTVDLIRVGTRVPVTMPMRVTAALARLLGSFREPGRREVALVTHVEHPYEITPELVTAVGRLRDRGVAVYNQLVYTFFVSRRFEAARLRLLLRRIGIDPYYTFIPKGKEETRSYRVPLARLLQEAKEEARMLPGLRRTDEPVYNVPRLGKNHLRAFQHRDLVSVLPDGARVYEFHPWEKMVLKREAYVATDVPILEYLQRLEAIGEDPKDYESIWYYF